MVKPERILMSLMCNEVCAGDKPIAGSTATIATAKAQIKSFTRHAYKSKSCTTFFGTIMSASLIHGAKFATLQCPPLAPPPHWVNTCYQCWADVGDTQHPSTLR